MHVEKKHTQMSNADNINDIAQVTHKQRVTI